MGFALKDSGLRFDDDDEDVFDGLVIVEKSIHRSSPYFLYIKR